MQIYSGVSFHKCLGAIHSIRLKQVYHIGLQAADDLLIGHQDTDEWWRRYPGY